MVSHSGELRKMSILDKKMKVPKVLAELQSRPHEAQQSAGYADTLREILQQPATWRDTAGLATGELIERAFTPAPQHIVLTGSGSSMYIGESLAPSLQSALGMPVQAIAAGTLLTHWRSVLPPGRGLLISLARSGDSPESDGVVSRLLDEAPGYRHLVITCNANGRLATQYRDDSRVTVLVLDERTNDRSLVMTSSFTNLLLAGAALMQGTAGALSRGVVDHAAANVQRIFELQADALAQLMQGNFSSAVYLGSGGALGAARECALKMMEMTGGKVISMAETFLGLRHGPMSSINGATLIVALLSPDPTVRAYEYDLLRELSRKGLGYAKVIVGDSIPADLVGANDVVIDIARLPADDEVPSLLAHVVVGQLLAFFRCLELGGKPDTPSQGVLTRVVEAFVIHGDGIARDDA
jgi:tagatose-6-phosphate ketose/aldose isomerase